MKTRNFLMITIILYLIDGDFFFEKSKSIIDYICHSSLAIDVNDLNLCDRNNKKKTSKN